MTYSEIIGEEAIAIKVPASSANIGAGFDCFGMALSLYNHYEIHRLRTEHRSIVWEGPKMVQDEENLVACTMDKILKEHDCELGYLLKMGNQDIPVSRGLGSSSAAIVAGIMGAFWLMKREFNEEEILFRAAVAEGHPDNSTPAFVGSFCVSKLLKNRVFYHRLNFPKELEILLMYPDFKLSTSSARSVMPMEYGIKDVVNNVSNASLLISSLYRFDEEAFSIALEDRIHVPYRLGLIDGASRLMEDMKRKKNCLGITISGAGSALIAFFKAGEDLTSLTKSCEREYENWKFLKLEVEERGAIYERCIGL